MTASQPDIFAESVCLGCGCKKMCLMTSGVPAPGDGGAIVLYKTAALGRTEDGLCWGVAAAPDDVASSPDDVARAPDDGERPGASSQLGLCEDCRTPRAGICTACKQTFVDLKAHMREVHPIAAGARERLLGSPEPAYPGGGLRPGEAKELQEVGREVASSGGLGLSWPQAAGLARNLLTSAGMSPRIIRRALEDATYEEISSIIAAESKPLVVSACEITTHDFDSELERAWAAELSEMQLRGDVCGWRYHPFILLLTGSETSQHSAGSLKYTPDFLVVGQDRVLEIHEVKGMPKNERDTRTRLTMARELLPFFRYCWVTRDKKNPRGGFKVETLT
jgi:hypothetical protein